MNWFERAAENHAKSMRESQMQNMSEIDRVNIDLEKLNKTIDWSVYPSPERQLKQAQFEMQYTQVYLNKRQIDLAKWLKAATIVVALMSIAQATIMYFILTKTH
jgi:hypothetical protein